MKFNSGVSNFLAKLQSLPEPQKKIVFFIIMAISALVVGFFGVVTTKNNLLKLGSSMKSVNLPELNKPSDSRKSEQDFKIDMPDIGIGNVTPGDFSIMPEDIGLDNVTEGDLESIFKNQDFNF